MRASYANERSDAPSPEMYILDTDVLIDIQRGHLPAVAWFASLTEVPLVPGIVVMELVQDANNSRQVQEVMKLVADLPVVWPSVVDCNRALSDFAAFNLSHGLGLLDSLIGACATGLAAELCTFNVKHYRNVAGLQTTSLIVIWAPDRSLLRSRTLAFQVDDH
jgi:predicted nucleic acid-binding protein